MLQALIPVLAPILGKVVGNLFPEHLKVPQIENLPAMLASYLEGVMFPSRAKKIEGVAKSFKAA